MRPGTTSLPDAVDHLRCKQLRVWRLDRHDDAVADRHKSAIPSRPGAGSMESTMTRPNAPSRHIPTYRGTMATLLAREGVFQ